MEAFFLDLFSRNGEKAEVRGDAMYLGGSTVPIVNDIPRFTPNESYSDNFALLRERHAALQLDSRNGTTDRYDTILARTNWPAEFFKGKLVLECGCGAGPDTEVLLSLGCRLLSVDLTGCDIAKRNVGANPNVQFVQGSIADLPLKKRSFDIVFCHRVLQHTPDPSQILAHILQFVKDDGAIFVHSYANSFIQRARWKYALLPFTRRLAPVTLYNLIRLYARPAFHLTSVLCKLRLGRALNWFFVPFLNYRHRPQYAAMTDEEMITYGIHDTFDALSPRYDRPISVSIMRRIANDMVRRPFEIFADPFITLLRTRVETPRKPDGSPGLAHVQQLQIDGTGAA